MQKYGNSPLINTEGKRTVMPSTRAVSIFEGSFDFLSWQVLQNAKTPTTDILVLNSVNNLDNATGYLNLHESFICFLDNDLAGRKCLEDIQKMFPGKEIKDMSGQYSQHKDLNEMLQNCRGYDINDISIKHSL